MRIEDLTKLREIATIFSLVAVPLIVAVIGWVSAHATVNQQYVALAIGILQSSAPDAKGANNDELRRWAADIIDAKAPVTLPPSLKARLVSGELRFAGTGAIVESPDLATGIGSVTKTTPSKN
jgi:hypothetical protein